MEKIVVDCRKRWERIIVVIHRYVSFIVEDEKIKILDYAKIDNVKGFFLLFSLLLFPNESNYVGFLLISQINYFCLETLVDKILKVVDSGSSVLGI